MPATAGHIKNSNIAHKDLSDNEYAIAQGIAITNVDNGGAPQSHGPSSAEQEMWDDFMLTNSAFKIEQGTEEIFKSARKEFECKIEGFGLWGHLKTMPEEDTGRVEHAWDKAEQDDILTEILQNLGQAKIYQKK